MAGRDLDRGRAVRGVVDVAVDHQPGELGALALEHERRARELVAGGLDLEREHLRAVELERQAVVQVLRREAQEEAVEILVQLKNGDRRAVVQAKAAETFAPGDAVILVTTGGRVRVTKAPAVTAPATTPTGAPARS